MTEPVQRPKAQGIRKYSFGDLELDWYKLPWLDVADRDHPFVKRGTVDLDPVGGLEPAATISLGGQNRGYIRIDQVDITYLDLFSLRNVTVVQRIDTTPHNYWRQFDDTVSPDPLIEAEFAVNRLFTIPPGKHFNLIFTNTSALGRGRFDFEIRGSLSRIAN